MGMESFSSCLSWICNIFGEFQCDITYFVMYIYVDSKESTPAGAKAGQRPWFLVGTNQTEWKSIVWVNEVATWLSLPSETLSINSIYVYDKGRVVFPQHILLFLPQTALLIFNLINSYKFCHEKGRVFLKRQFYSHFSNKKTAIFIFICL